MLEFIILLPWTNWFFITLNVLWILILLGVVCSTVIVVHETRKHLKSEKGLPAQTSDQSLEDVDPKVYIVTKSLVPKGTFSDIVDSDPDHHPKPASDEAFLERKRIVGFLRNQIYAGGWWQQTPHVVLKTMADAIERGIALEHRHDIAVNFMGVSNVYVTSERVVPEEVL